MYVCMDVYTYVSTCACLATQRVLQPTLFSVKLSVSPTPRECPRPAPQLTCSLAVPRIPLWISHERAALVARPLAAREYSRAGAALAAATDALSHKHTQVKVTFHYAQAC